ncbi:hypothetical protein GCM10022416_07970 [Actinomadura keratinilytica]|uniref:Uncharacterized protein n=1 Tax=Actinomadura keratinilytica TaxID=547461 RepID=A0ABP7Y4M7_9ACTN
MEPEKSLIAGSELDLAGVHGPMALGTGAAVPDGMASPVVGRVEGGWTTTAAVGPGPRNQDHGGDARLTLKTR